MEPSSSSSGEGLSPDQRLRKSADYLCCYRRGRKRHGSLASLHFHPNSNAEARLGITASRKVGKAVIRHRTKRRIREIFRRWPRRHELASWDVVVHLKPGAGQADFQSLRQEIEHLLAQIGVSEKRAGSQRSRSHRRSRPKRR